MIKVTKSQLIVIHPEVPSGVMVFEIPEAGSWFNKKIDDNDEYFENLKTGDRASKNISSSPLNGIYFEQISFFNKSMQMRATLTRHRKKPNCSISISKTTRGFEIMASRIKMEFDIKIFDQMFESLDENCFKMRQQMEQK